MIMTTLAASSPSSSLQSDSPKVETARQCSLVVSAFPWNNRTILIAKDLAQGMPSNDFSLRYIENIAAFEKQIRSPDFESSKLRRVLHVIPRCDLDIEYGGPTKHRQLYRLFFHYRLIEYFQRSRIPVEVSDVSEDIPGLPIHCHAKQLYSSCQSFTSKFKDWTAVLKRFRSSMSSLANLSNPPNLELLPRQPGMNTRVNLLLSLARTARREDAEAVSTNFVAAALYLHHLLNEPDLKGKRLPDLPDGKLGRELIKQWCQTGGNTIAAQEYSQQEEENRDEQYRAQGEYGQARDFAQLENDQTRDGAELQLGHEDRLGGPGSSLGAQDRIEVECNQPPDRQAPNVEVPLSDQDCEDVCKTIGEVDVGKLRLALQSAVYISPILLLSDAKIYRWNWNQLDILKFAKDLGNNTPKIIRRINDIVFQTVVDLATGQKDTSFALRELCDKIPWDELELPEVADTRFWFSAEHRKAPKDLFMLGVNLAEPLANEWSFAADLRREAGAAFKINGEAPTWTPNKEIPTAPTVPEVGPDSGARRSSDIDGSAHGSQNAAATSSCSTAAQAPEGLEGPNETPPIHASHANDESKASPPPTKTAIAPAVNTLDGPPADAAKKRHMDKQEKEAAQHAQDLKTATPRNPKRIPKKKKKKNSKKPTDADSAGADSKPKSTALPISEDTTKLVKQSLREYYWQQAKVREEYEPSTSEKKLAVENSPASGAQVIYQRFGEENDFSVFSPLREEISVKPAMHFAKNVEILMDFVSTAKELNVLDKPLHSSESELTLKQSCFRVIEFAEFSNLKPKEFREVIRSQTVITVDKNAIPGNFNMDSLLQFQSFSTTFDIEDFSTIDPTMRSGTISDILKCAEQNKARQIVQVKCMPCSAWGWKDGPFSTDYAAWRATEGFPFAKDHCHLPIAEFHHKFVATKGAHRWWDVASRGFGKYITVQTGGLCVWIARPKARAENGVLCPSDYDILGKIDLFVPTVYKNVKPRNPYWLVEQIYLGPGMTIYLKPGTTFALYHAENTIGIGGYFYTTGLMAETFYATVHDFIFEQRVIKTDCSPSLIMIHRIVQFYHAALTGETIHEQDPAREHLPDLTAVEGVIDFFALCMLGIFCNVLDIRTYQCGPDMVPSNFLLKFHVEDDANNISVEERHKCIRTRGLAHDLIFWFFDTHEVTNNDTHEEMTRKTWFIPHLTRVTATMIHYVELYEDFHSSNRIENEFREQVKLCFHSEHDIQVALEDVLKSSSASQPLYNTLAYLGPRNLTMKVRTKSLYEAPGPYYLLITGYSGGDTMFFGLPKKYKVQDADNEEDEHDTEDGSQTTDSENKEDGDSESPEGPGSELGPDDEHRKGEGESENGNSAEQVPKPRLWHLVDSYYEEELQGSSHDSPREHGEPQHKRRRLL